MTAAPLCQVIPENELVTKAKLDIQGDRIHYRLYQQDGTMQPMDCPDTPSNRLFVSWVQAHDRYHPAERPWRKRSTRGSQPADVG